MIFFIVGNILSLFTYSLYFSYLNNIEKFHTVEIFLGWFLLEHVFEEYNTTAGKLFLNYEDFRTLIKNVLFLARNLVFVAQILTPAEFIFINTILFFFIIKYKQKLKSDVVKILIIFIYGFILNSFLFVDLNNILIGLGYMFVLYLLFISLILYFNVMYYFVFLRVLFKTKNNFNFKLFTMKFLFYISVTFFIIFLVIAYLIVYSNSSENFIQEFVLSNIIFYSYFK